MLYPDEWSLSKMEYYTIEYYEKIGNDEHIIGDDYYSDQIYFRTANNDFKYLIKISRCNIFKWT